MKKHIGIFVDSKKKSGGAYQELLYIIKNFEKFKDKYKITIIFSNNKLDINLDQFKSKVIFLNMGIFQRYYSYLRNFNIFFRKIKKFLLIKNTFEKLIKKNRIDLIYFTGPSQYSLYLENSKFIITIPDVSHRENLEFTEMINNSEFERREDILSKSLPKAILVVTNAEIIKERITFFYKILQDRICVVNHQPSLIIDNFIKINLKIRNEFKKKFKLPKNYLFYPAMYFPHKNHITLINSIELLKLSNYRINLVCCGNDNGHLKYLKNYVNKKKLEKNVIFLDFVEDKYLPYLYKSSSMLVMTSLIGPTNIPPWEAFKLGIPVIYPKLEGINEVYKKSCLYYEPTNHYDLASKIKKLLLKKKLRDKLILAGKKTFRNIKSKNEFFKIINLIDDFFLKKIYEIIHQFKKNFMKTYNDSINKGIRNFLKLRFHLKIIMLLKIIGVKYVVYKFIFFFMKYIYICKSSFIKSILFDILKYKHKITLIETNNKEKFVIFTNDTVISKELYISGEFDLKKLKRTINFLNSKIKIKNLYDIGANIGVICIPAVNRGLVDFAYAVEPEIRNFNLLRYNVSINDLQEKIKLYNYALSHKNDKLVRMELSDNNSGDHRVLNKVNYNIYGENKRKIIKVKSKRFDTLFPKLNSKNNLVWIDTQGYEPVILSGAQKLINSKTPIVLEFWPYALKRNGNWENMLKLLEKFNYFVDLSKHNLVVRQINSKSIDLLASGWDKEKFNKYSLYTDLLLLKE